MKKTRIILGAIALVLIVGGLAWVAQRFGVGKEEKKTGPIPEVQVAKVERKTITEKVIVYGSVVAQPGKTHSVSIAFETRVRHVLVAPGQFVKENDPLIEIELSPAAQVQFQQAKNAAEAAQKELKQTQERFNLKLATNQELSAAEKTARDAEAQLTALQRAGAGGDKRIHSDISGVIAKVDAQDGQIVPAGGPLVVPRSAVLPNESREFEVFTVANNRAVKHTVKIGAENSNELQVLADDLHPGDPVVTVGNYELEDGMAVEIKK